MRKLDRRTTPGNSRLSFQNLLAEEDPGTLFQFTLFPTLRFPNPQGHWATVEIAFIDSPENRSAVSDHECGNGFYPRLIGIEKNPIHLRMPASGSLKESSKAFRLVAENPELTARVPTLHSFSLAVELATPGTLAWGKPIEVTTEIVEEKVAFAMTLDREPDR